MRDLLPGDMARFRRTEEAFRHEMLGWGYDEIRTPTIERLHLFTSAGTLSPHLLERVYSFLDWDGWSGERVVLRPDATIPAGRLYSEHLSGLAKLFYVENIFRFAQGDEPRELWQCGAEVYGDTWPSGDIELIAGGLGTLRRLGVDGARVLLSHTGVVRALLARAGFAPEERAERYDRILDGDLSVTAEIEARLPDLRAPLHLLFDLTGTSAAYLANIRAAFVEAAPDMAPALDELSLVAEALAAIDCSFEISMTLARDFEYYTGPVFQFATADGAGLGGGGRYDALVRRADGTAIPACGFAFYMDRLAELLTGDQAERGAVVQVAAEHATAGGIGLALSLARELQEAGFCAELVGSRRSPDCRWVLTVGAGTSQPRYELRDLQQDSRMTASSMAQIIAALGRGKC
ncbi:MAG: ATP phosphoribosyltransferase regulatory subunit [Chloroflexi bacterium]|nr:ATP phosphoribosyltransferase regulatory subunit [Chloroflexota bacterium]